MNYVFGYDPGGKNANGVALLEIGSYLEILDYSVATVDSQYDAEQWLNNNLSKPLLAVGIDSFLHWERTSGSSRQIDTFLRTTLSGTAAITSVLNSNSTRGSMTIQGIIMAMELRKKYPHLIINEAHPKVTYYVHTNPNLVYDFKNNKRNMEAFLDGLISQHNLSLGYPTSIKTITTKNDDEWDALYAALFTFIKGPFLPNIQINDLVKSNTSSTLIYPISDVSFLWF